MGLSWPFCCRGPFSMEGWAWMLSACAQCYRDKSREANCSPTGMQLSALASSPAQPADSSGFRLTLAPAASFPPRKSCPVCACMRLWVLNIGA